MARARKLVRNPAIPRLEWVAKNYPDSIWLLTVLGFMEAAAMDDARSLMEAEAEAVVDMNEGGESLTYSGFLSDGVAYQIREYGTENTEYDRYIPWLAKSLNRVTKKPVKKLREVFEKAYPGLVFDRGLPHVVKGMAEDDVALAKLHRKFDRMESDPVPILVDAFTVSHNTIISRINDAWYYLDALDGPAYTEARDLIDLIIGDVPELISSFGTVVRWAEGDGVNLDDYEPLEAVQLAKEWAARQPKDPNIVAGDVVYEFDDGWDFQELKTGAHLRCEGKYLDHCVKDYKPSNIGVVYRIFSLRDPEGRPVATLRWEIDGEYVQQYYGMSNKIPERDELLRGAEFRLNYLDKNLVTIPRTDDWSVWKSGARFPIPRLDFLVKQLDRFDIAPSDVQANPRKRKKTPEYKKLLDRSRRLWETYDAQPLKKHLVAFGTHVERMKKSESAKVKAEARRAARAFNAEFRARGWKK